ncbi:diphthamide biosynthesis protein, partial [Wilcoxina mikolae CBS 423.85]
APVLSTPDDHVFKSLLIDAPPDAVSHRDLPEGAFCEMYEVDRTVAEVLQGGYKRIALQFPDERLGDSERVYEMIYRGINAGGEAAVSAGQDTADESLCCQGKAEKKPPCSNTTLPSPTTERKVFILADTSYSACCVDEIAAEHVRADVLVHYGRSCLSPTTRLPVIYVFTSNPLSTSAAVAGFRATYPDLDTKVLLMADITYASQTLPVYTALQGLGYTNVFPTEIIHDPASPLPNRTLPPEVGEEQLRDFALFHLSEPLPSLLLILASRVASIHYFDSATSIVCSTLTSPLLRRRYALVSHAKSAGIIGILVNTLNIKHYLPMISRLKQQIREAGRKSYLVVVGKVNVEKVANFSEIEVWVGVGCWEQGVVGGTEGRGWWRPVVTPWELGIALGEREWNGGWVADFGDVLKRDDERRQLKEQESGEKEAEDAEDEGDSDEDAPPEYDLRTGRYISTSRPLGRKPTTTKAIDGNEAVASSALTAPSNRQKELVESGGVLSPAAVFLREKRTWQGLGSDLDVEQEGALVEEGRSGVARGYIVGKDGIRH